MAFDQLLHIFPLLNDVFWRLPLPNVVDGDHGYDLQPTWLVQVEVSESPRQVSSPATHNSLHLEVLGHVQGGVVPNIVQDTASQEKPPGLTLWEVNWLLLIAERAVVGIC